MSNIHAMGPYLLNPAARELTREGLVIKIGDRQFDILRVLRERPGQVVPKREILQRVWPDTLVDESALRVHISTLRRTFEATPGGEVRILNVSGRGYTLSVLGEDYPQPQYGTGSPTSHNLPSRRTRLIGRDAITRDLIAQVQDARLTTLVGPGGIGKTSIALAVAESLIPKFDRVCLVDFSSIDQPSRALPSVVLALQLTGDANDPLPAIVAHLSRGSTLLVLDNCEHVVDEAARLADALLETPARIRVLATSREPLNIASERVHHIASLESPPLGAKQSTVGALGYGAVQLFAERALQASEYTLTDEDAEAVCDICRRLDGLPLAIELAAAWVKPFPPKVLLRQLMGEPLLGLEGRRTAQSRHRTLEGMLDWSYDRLPAPLQDLFARLSVFRSEFSMAHALAVGGGDRRAVTLGLATLVTKSLVDVRREGGEARYRILLVPRTYGEDCLIRGENEVDARRRHAEVVLALERDADRDWLSLSRSEWIRRYGRIVDDVRAALDWALSDAGDADLACRLAYDTAALWFRLSLTSEGTVYLEAALTRLDRESSKDRQLDLRLRTARAILLIFTHNPTHTVLKAWAEVDAITDVAADRDTGLLCAWAHWLMYIFVGHYRASLSYADRFRELVGDNLGDEIAALRMTSLCQLGLGRLDLARSGLERVVNQKSMLAYQSTGTRFQYDQVSSSLVYLARTLWLQGESDAAMDAAERSVAVGETTQHNLTLCFALLDGLAQTAVLCGRHDVAEAALDRYRSVPLTGLLDAELANGLMGIMISETDPNAAMPLVRQCCERKSVSDAIRIAPSLGMLCEALGRGGDLQQGLAIVDELLLQFSVEPSNCNLPELRRAKAALLVMGKGAAVDNEVEALLDEALKQSIEQGSVAWERKIRADLAKRSAVRGAGN